MWWCCAIVKCSRRCGFCRCCCCCCCTDVVALQPLSGVCEHFVLFASSRSQPWKSHQISVCYYWYVVGVSEEKKLIYFVHVAGLCACHVVTASAFVPTALPYRDLLTTPEIHRNLVPTLHIYGLVCSTFSALLSLSLHFLPSLSSPLSAFLHSVLTHLLVSSFTERWLSRVHPQQEARSYVSRHQRAWQSCSIGASWRSLRACHKWSKENFQRIYREIFRVKTKWGDYIVL